MGSSTSSLAGFHGEIGSVVLPPIVMLVGDLDVTGLIPHALADRATIYAHSVEHAVELAGQSDANTLVCSILLSHLETRSACVETVERLAAVYKLILFFEPSSHEHDYLARLHLKSFHAGMTNNRSMGVLNTDLFLGCAGLAEVEHYGRNIAHDDSAIWLVPLDAPPDTYPPGTSWRPRYVFDCLVFEFGCFVCRGYDSPSLDLRQDLLLISFNRKQAAFRLSGAAAGKIGALEHIAREIYRSPGTVGITSEQTIADDSGLAPAGPFETELERRWVQNRPGLSFDLRLSVLSNCVVTGHGAVLTNGILVAESQYMLSHLVGQHAVRDGMSRRHADGRIEGLSIVALMVASNNYFHWLAQVVPAMILAREACELSGIDNVTLITREPEPFFGEHIKLVFEGFGAVNVVALRPFEYVTTSRSLYATCLGEGPIDRVVAEHRPLVARMKAQFDLTQRPPWRSIYISRLDTRARIVTNEAELIDSLVRRGIEIVTLSGLSVADQIKLFHEAKMIVGPHGAGLANVVFARPGAILLELSQTEYSIPCFLRLAQAVGVHHVMQFFDGRDTSYGTNQGWSVDVDAVGVTIDRLLERSQAVDVADCGAGD